MVDVVAALRGLADEIDWPEADVAADVGARVRAGERGRLPVARLRLVAVAVAVVVLAAALVAGIPASRSAVADWLGIGAVHVKLSPRPLHVVPPGKSLSLGTPATLAEARAGVSFTVQDPPAALGAPDAVYVGRPPTSGQVAYVYGPRAGLPATSDPAVGALVTQFKADLQTEFFGKLLGPDTTLRSVNVGGVEGFWMEGRPHAFFYNDGSASNRIEDIRLAGNTLLWERDGITFRLESALTQAEALRIAESMP